MHVYTIPDRFSWGRCKRWHRSVLKTDPTLAIFLGSGAERRKSQRCKNRSKDGAPNEGLSGMAFATALKDKLNTSHRNVCYVFLCHVTRIKVTLSCPPFGSVKT